MKKTIIIFCLLSGYLVLFLHLGAMPFYGADEPRYARIGQEMLESGDFITPTLDQRPWLEKPPLLFWMESASYAVFGVNEMSARLPNALLSLLAALALGYLGWRVTGDAWVAVFAYMVLLSSYFFVVFGRAASTDMALTVPYALMLICSFIALEENSVKWSAVAGFAGALAILAKGPVGVVLALGTLFLFLVVLKKIPSWKTVTAFSLAIIGVGLPWFVLAWAVNGENFFYTFIVNHHIARFVTDLHHHSQPFWYYIPVLLAGFFPWVFFLFPAASDFLKRRKNSSDPLFRLALYLWLWAGVPILFFSASSAKLPGYILPSIPALALLVALEWRRCREDNVELLSGGVFQLVVLGMALVIGIALPLASRMEYGELEVGLVAGIPLLAGVAIGLWWGRKRLFDSSFIAFSGGIVLSLASLFAVGSPVLAKYHSTSELVQSVNPEISASQPLVQYRFFHHTAAYYTSGRVTPDSINDPGEMAEYIKSNPQADYYLLTTSHGLEEFQALPGTEISGPVGKLYILRLWNGDGQLAQRIEEFSGIFKPGS